MKTYVAVTGFVIVLLLLVSPGVAQGQGEVAPVGVHVLAEEGDLQDAGRGERRHLADHVGERPAPLAPADARDDAVGAHAVAPDGDLHPRLVGPLALGGHGHIRESIRYESATRTRFHQAAAVVGPTTDVVSAISGVTMYRVRDRVIDDGEFIPLR